MSEKKAYVLPCEYVDALRRTGLEVLLLPLGGAETLLDRLDGLVLAGGGDIDPSVYGGRQHETTYMVDRARDEFELALVRRAVAWPMPVLAICRGMQILNVARGGDLIAHVPERYGESVVHRLPPREPVPHPVHVEAGSRLAGIVGDAALESVSWHHQAVDRMGADLRAVAHAADGLVEAVELDGADWVFGVQWHPELNAAGNPRQAALFDAFAEAVVSHGRRSK